MEKLAARGLLRLSRPGPRPKAPPPLRLAGKPLSETIIEDRF